MYVQRYGDGPLAALGLHGWSGDHRTFAPLAPYLPATLSLYAPDLPGCGQSPPPREWRLEAVLDELIELTQVLPAPITLLGNCSGAILGLCVARRLYQNNQGGRLRRLVLIDPFAYWPWYFRVFASDSLGSYAYRLSFGTALGRRLINLALIARRRRQTDLTEGFRLGSPAVALGYLRLLREVRDVNEFAGLPLAVRILHGERTFRAVRRSLERFRALWVDVDVRSIPGAGHLPLREAPAAVAASIFLEP